MEKMKSQQGFSLIELMMVVVIIGVLAGIGIPQYQKFQMKARQSEVKSLLSSMYTAQKAFYAEWNQYYADFNAVGYGLDGHLGYNVGFSTTNASGPATHPNTDYNDAPATVKNSKDFCSTRACTISKSKVTNIPLSELTETTFVFGGRANLDEDDATDDWTLNTNKIFVQLTDDISELN